LPRAVALIQDTHVMLGPRPDLRNVLVLLVEDDPDTLELTALVLRGCGATVTPVPGPRQALDQARQRLPHVVVTDISMPEEDGYWLAEQLEASGMAGVPVIALTAHRRSEYARGRQDRFRAWIRKPFDPVGLCRSVRDVVAAGLRPPGHGGTGCAQTI
jgi:CheY-like chemotaxis protein